MEPITLAVIATFVTPYLIKAGEKAVEKISEKAVEKLLASRHSLATSFTELFHTEIHTLGLSDNATTEQITKKLEAKPEIEEEILKKVEANQDLLKELIEIARKSHNPEFEGLTINAEKIAQVNYHSTVTLNIENF